jgi:hypothetical protein
MADAAMLPGMPSMKPGSLGLRASTRSLGQAPAIYIYTPAAIRSPRRVQPIYFLGLMGATVPDFGLGMNTEKMPLRQRSIGLPMRSRKAARDVTTCFRVIGDAA